MKKRTEPNSTEHHLFADTDINRCFADLVAAIYEAGDLLATLKIDSLQQIGEIKTENDLEHYQNLLEDAVESFQVADEIFAEIRRNQMVSAQNALSDEWTLKDGELIENETPCAVLEESDQIALDELLQNF